MSISAWDYPGLRWIKGVDGPTNSSAFYGDCDLAITQGLPLLDILKSRVGLCDPEIVGWVRVDANIRFGYGGGSCGHDDEGEGIFRDN